MRDLRDRVLIATLTYSFARIDAALKMKVEDLRPKGAGWQVQLNEKGGKQYVMRCHHALAEALRAYLNVAGISEDRKGWLFRTSPGYNGTVVTEQPMDQSAAWLMIRQRAVDFRADWQSHVSSNRDHRLSFERRCARACSVCGRMKVRARQSTMTERRRG